MNKSDAPNRGRPRSEQSRQAILTAALALTGHETLRSITADAIAKEAGVSKATLYKWWPNKVAICLDAFSELMAKEVTIPNHHSIRLDFIEELQAMIRFYSSDQGRLFREFIAESQYDRQIQQEFRARFLEGRRKACKVIWERAVQRGEVNEQIDVDIAMDLIYGPAIFRLFTNHAPLNRSIAEQIVDAVFYGIKR
ncbi:Fatty acid metabolism regulator protein [Marinomonas spartinae]|uniref:Fatty acid metabolism regulator protein n=1 Tax=Marinomonas spartinae TaxID=1792290 RepID=A0A1A8TQX6_9GAMM|nr:TetR/AcrR family transcriptional regulator [Marinomonas spartinae]SBS31626.1 Fatty acid metabolism regulator protein [Marinomonas spartinae]SBS36391.1 Fatty acid metabolism regulator protein [Marinomonas spartinae]